MADIIIQQDGCLGRIMLDRPKALNALSYEMVLEIIKALQAWRNDHSICCVIIEGAGERAFCAGGDIRMIYEKGQDNPGMVRQYWADEYYLNAMIKNYPKPYIAIMDGFTFGGGVGAAAHGSHRIVTERAVLGLPEVAIGFIPDIGGSWLLARAPGKTGLYCGLTAANMNPADALYAGFADYYIPSSNINALIAELREKNTVDESIKKYAADPEEPSLLQQHRDEIDDFFSQETVVQSLERIGQSETQFAKDTLKTLEKHAPFSVASAFYLIAKATAFMSLEESLSYEYRYAYRCLEKQDFYEGIRAAVIDKDRSPKWEHPTIADVRLSDVEAMFESLGDNELTFDR